MREPVRLAGQVGGAAIPALQVSAWGGQQVGPDL